jgi:hypothetical protein
MFAFILAIIGMICTIMMINAAFRLGNRIAVASEATALSTAALYHALTPEAKARADEALAFKQRTIDERSAARGYRMGRLLAVAAGLVLLYLLGMGFARAADQTIATGQFCMLNPGELTAYVQAPDCKVSEVVEFKRNKVIGFEWGCTFIDVKYSRDNSVTSGRVAHITADCDGTRETFDLFEHNGTIWWRK